MRSNVIGRIRNTNLPKSQGLLPLFETIINSVDAIEESGISLEDGRINVKILRKPTFTLEVEGEKKQKHYSPISGFIIHDNGIGFVEKNYLAFNEADTQIKANRGGKGVGRFLWLKAFEKAKVDSIFQQEGSFYRRIFEFSLATPDGIKDHEIEEIDGPVSTGTTVQLFNLLDEYENKVPRSSNTIAQRIVEHCLEYYVLGNMPEVILQDEEGEAINLDTHYEELVANTEKESIEINGHTFDIIHFLLHARLDLKHQISYCGNNRVVTTDYIGNKIPNLPSTISLESDDDSYIYACYISSKYLDTNINQERTDFTIMKDIAPLLPDTLTWKNIEEQIQNAVHRFLSPYTDAIRTIKEEKIREYVNEQAPEYRHIIKNHPEKLDSIQPNISDENLDTQLYEIHREIEIGLRRDANHLIQHLELVDQTQELDSRWEELSKFWQEWNEVGKANLAKYIIHRRKMLAFLEEALKRRKNGKYSHEEVIHRIVFPLRSTSDDITYDQHNLWIIDEKLAYHQYLASDMPLSQVEKLESESMSRPDLLVFFDRAIAVVDEEAPYNSGVVIFEFKRPMRDDIDAKDNPIQQVLRYVEEIKGGKEIDKDGRPVNVPESTPFYCYIICDLTKRLKDQAKYHGLRPTPDAAGYFGYNEIVGAYIEIIDFEKMVRDSKKRNRILFDKLNLPEAL